jgi:ATP-binding cassette subfamily B multidrug efflux pump
VFEFLEEAEMEDEIGKEQILPTAKGKVSFDQVKFAYEDSENLIIKNFSADVKPGQC